jgi:hypothetical protein
MRFDSNRAWKEATGAVKASRDVLLALAGVFFMLPGLIVSIIHPQPEPPSGLEGEAAIAFMSQYYAEAAPLLVAVAVIQAIGTLALLTLFTDRTRPTVGEAIRAGAVSLVFYLAAQLLLGLGFALLAGLVLGLLGVTGVTALVAVGVILVVVALVYVMVKTSLTAPVVAVDNVRNPIQAIRRSWDLTKGNSVRLALFYLLLFVAFIIVLGVVMGVLGIVLAVVLGGEGARIGTAVISSALTAIGMLYFVAILAAVHRQLAGPSPEAVSATFE